MRPSLTRRVARGHLAALGPLRTITFPGFLSYGVEDAGAGRYGTGYLFQRSMATGQAHAIKQKGGSSVWPAAARAGARIERIAGALRTRRQLSLAMGTLAPAVREARVFATFRFRLRKVAARV